MTTINDREWAFLAEATDEPGPFNDMYFKYLRGLGYTGTLQDMIAKNGGGLTPSKGGAWWQAPVYAEYQAVADLPNDRYALPPVGPELVVPASWSGSASGGTASGSNDGGVLTITGDGTANYRFDQQFLVENGETYILCFDLANSVSSFRVGTTLGGVDLLPSQSTQIGKRAYVFTASGTAAFIRLAQTSATSAIFSGISLRKISLAQVGGAYPKRVGTFGDFLRYEQALSASEVLRLWSLHDDFERADGPLGTAPTGQAWSYIADAPTRTVPSISGGKVVTYDSGQSTTACYNFIELPRPPKSMRAKVSFTPGTANGRATLISTNKGRTSVNDHIIGGSIHANFGTTGVQDALFSPAGNYVSSNISYGSFSMVLDGVTEYTIGWDLDGDDMWYLLPSGARVLGSRGSLYQLENGRFLCFEHYWETGQCQVQFNEVWAG